jgi:hypothetical protein
LKAILTYEIKVGDEIIEQNRLFDTARAQEVCTVKNSFKYEIETIFLSNNGMLFIQDNETKLLRLPSREERQTRWYSQEDLKKWIGQNEPDSYIKFFGEVEEG